MSFDYCQVWQDVWDHNRDIYCDETGELQNKVTPCIWFQGGPCRTSITASTIDYNHNVAVPGARGKHETVTRRTHTTVLLVSHNQQYEYSFSCPSGPQAPSQFTIRKSLAGGHRFILHQLLPRCCWAVQERHKHAGIQHHPLGVRQVLWWGLTLCFLTS